MEKFSDCWTYPKQKIDELLQKFVPITRKINGKGLDGNVTLNANDVGAEPVGQAILKRSIGLGAFVGRTDDDLDNLNKESDVGIYGVTYDVAHTPDNWGTLYVTVTISGIMQIFIKTNIVYTRQFSGNPQAWSKWYKYTGTAVD